MNNSIDYVTSHFATWLYSFFTDLIEPTYYNIFDLFFTSPQTIGGHTYTLIEFMFGPGLALLIPIIILKFVIGIVT